MIEDYVNSNLDKSICFSSLGQLRYLSAINHVDCVIGNSSSGLIEVPSFKTPTVNIGDRQRGRIRGNSVIQCEPEFNEIKKAIKKSISNNFKKNILLNSVNPYGLGNSSEMIINKLKNVDLNNILKKRFYDF